MLYRLPKRKLVLLRRYLRLSRGQAADFETALKNLVEGMKGTMADWVIVSITETPLMDVYPFDPERKTKEEDRPQE